MTGEAQTAAFASELIEAIADGVSVVDDVGQPVLVNEAFCTMTGYSRSELLTAGSMAFPYWPPEEYDRILAAFERMRGADYGPYALVFSRKDGTRFPCSVAPAKVCVDGRTLYIATVKDLTEVRWREARVAELSRLVDTMTQVGDLATWDWTLDQPDIRVSESWHIILGEVPGPPTQPASEMVSRVHPDDVEATQREMQALLSDQVRLYEVEHRLRTADGSWRWFLARGVVLERDEDGRPLRVGGTTQNIHRFKLQEESLRQLQKMQVLGQLTGGIAHDFNNILQVLHGNLELLEESAQPDQVEDIAAMDDAVRRATNLTRALLRYVRKQASLRERTNVAGFVRAARSVLTTATASAVRLRFDLTGGDAEISIEPTAFENALLNLVVNARDAARSTEDGVVTVSTGTCELSPEASAEHGCVPGPYVTVRVADNGCGMTQDVLRRATEPLFTTRGGGTGLGLSMVRRFVREAAGFMGIVSAPGEGTRVTLGFPRATGVPQSASPARPLVDTGVPAARVLVVDDEVELLRAVATGLESLGYEVLTAEQPSAALELLGEHSVDLLVTDIAMPHSLNGIGLVTRARTIVPDLRVLFVTGFVPQSVEDEARALGPLLWKPFQIAELNHQIRVILDPASAEG